MSPRGYGIKRVIGTTPQICRTGVACYRVCFGINQVPEKDFMIDHISDLSDLDANFFVLLGGQDGRLGSAALTDQFTLWRAGEYIQMPLRLETVRRLFPLVTRLTP